MYTCKQITELATEHAEGALEDGARRSFESHLAGCADCRAWIGQLQVTSAALGRLPAPELPAALESELMRRFAIWQEGREAGAVARRPEPARRALATVAIMLGLVAALVALGREPSRSAADWGVGLALVAVAVALAAALRRLTLGFAAAATSVALVAALARGGPGPVSLLAGLECLATEAVVAAGTAGMAWVVARRGPGGLLRPGLGAWAVAGALAGDATLQITCSHHAALSHLLVFHAGGVLAVLAASWLWSRPALQPA